MLALRKPNPTPAACTPNVLPCRIDHTGPSKVSKRYWAPKDKADGTQTAYFRGRRLRGRKVKVPVGFEGVVVTQTEKVAEQGPAATVQVPSYDGEDYEEEEADELQEPVKVLDVDAKFDEIVVWSHNQLPAADDAFVRGIEEWVSFAKAIHQHSEGA